MRSRLFFFLVLVLATLSGCGDDDGMSDASADARIDVAIDVTDVEADVPDTAPPPPPTVLLPRSGIVSSEVAVLINDADPQSVTLGEAYAEARAIPDAHVLRVTLPTSAVLSPAAFDEMYTALSPALGDVQAFAVSFTNPHRVGCMSITSALALGAYGDEHCNTSGAACSTIAAVDYFRSTSTTPAVDHGVRPAMMLAAANVDDGLALIARGVAADDTFPSGDGYLVRTTDAIRSVRAGGFPAIVEQWEHEGGLRLEYLDTSDGAGVDGITGTDDVLFYFTGLRRVPDLATNTYLPGAIADHLTSFGGIVPESSQMSVVEWIAAGVTGSYGTVVEPCAMIDKFPRVPLVIEEYFRGATLVEAYWKSVRTPGEGLFVGDPLARPYGAQEVTITEDQIIIETNAVQPGDRWVLEGADTEGRPFEFIQEVAVDVWQRQRLVLPRTSAQIVRLRRDG